MRVTKQAKKVMFDWLHNRYGTLQAINVIDKFVSELDRRSYSVVLIGDEEVHARRSTLKVAEGIYGASGEGVRIWVNEFRR